MFRFPMFDTENAEVALILFGFINVTIAMRLKSLLS